MPLAENAPGAGKSGVAGLGADASSIAALLKLFTKTPGQKTTESTTETTGLQLGEEQVQNLLKSILEGTGSVQGLAAVSGGQKAPGLFNSTTQQQLTNDLLARISTEVSAKAAPTTRTVTGQRNVGAQPAAIDPVKALIATLGGTLGKKAFAASGAEEGIDDLISSIFGGGKGAGTPIDGEAFANFFSGASGGDSIFNTASSPGISSGLSDSVSQLFSGGGSLDSVGGFVNGGLDELVNFSSANGQAASFSTDIAASASPITGDVGGAFGGVSSGGSAVSDAFSSSASIFDETDFLAQSFGVDAFGDQAAQLAEQTAGFGFDAVDFGGGFDASGFGFDFAPGPLALGKGLIDIAGQLSEGNPFGAIFGSFIGNIFGGGGCFITTATCEVMGLADDCDELQTLREFRDSWLKENHPEDITQYYEEAPGIVERIKKIEESEDLFIYLYHAFIYPAVEKIKAEDFQGAYITYKQLFNVAKAFAGAEKEKD